MTPRAQKRSRAATVMLCSTGCSGKSPPPRRSSGTSPTPRRRAAAVESGGSRCPPTSISPSRRGSAPRTARASSVRPAPISPEKPTISPRWARKLTSRTRAVDRFRTSRATSPLPAGAGAASEPRALPAIREISRSPSSSATGAVRTSLPSRSTVTRSEIARISSSLCDTYRIAAPSCFSRRISANSRSISRGLRAEVGSSRMRTRADCVSACATSTSCCSPMPRCRTWRRGSTSRPTWSRAAAASS